MFSRLVLLVAASVVLRAQGGDASTPYSCVLGFLEAARSGDYAVAAQYLDLQGARGSGEDFARQLYSILDRGLSQDLTQLSRTPDGNLRDGLDPNRERIGQVSSKSGVLNIELERVQAPNQPAVWRFSAKTVREIPGFYSGMTAPALARYLPAPLVKIRFLSLQLWQWIAIAMFLVLAIALASTVTRALLPLMQAALPRFIHGADQHDFLKLRGPVRFILLAAAMRVVSLLSLSLVTRQLFTGFSVFLAIAGFAWLVIQLGNIVLDTQRTRLILSQKTDKIAMLELARRLAVIFVALIAITLLLERAGVNVTAMLAGLGVGGVALALAAQKTLENVFGGISLIMREAVHVGDLCQIAGQTGTVEDIGLGTTRIRTFDRTVIFVPNAQISQLNVENISMRDKFWFHQVFGLRYNTTAGQLRSILARIQEILQRDARVEEHSARVRFIGFGTSSLTLEIFAYVLEPDYLAFLRVQQVLLLAILDVIETAGASVASPLLVNDTASPALAGKT